MRRRIAVWIAVAVLSGCWFAGRAEDAVEVVDQTGEIVRIAQPVERVACAYGAGTYYVYTLGASEKLVMAWYIGVKGIASATEAMVRLEPRLEEILAFGDPNVEEILARDAQLVLVDGSRHDAFANQMVELGVPVVRYLVETPEALREAVLLTGRALGPDASTRAISFVADYDRILATVASSTASILPEERVRVLFLGTDLTQVASGDMYQTDLIAAAGGISVSEELIGYWNEVNLEQILLWDPEVILIPPYGSIQPEDVLVNPDWAAIRAVRDRRVHRMPRVIAPMDAPVPESLLGVLWMACVFYPDWIRLDLAAEADRFYALYYDYDLSDAERELMAGR